MAKLNADRAGGNPVLVCLLENNMDTSAYLGDAVYATYDGFHIKLQANGVGREATDTIYLEPAVIAKLVSWDKEGHVDHNTGKPFRKE